MTRAAAVVLAGALLVSGAAAAQTPPSPPSAGEPAPHVHPGGDAAPGQVDHSEHSAATMLFRPREASGTSWLPENAPMYGIHREAGAWRFMWHGAAFAQYLFESGERGSDQAGSINWVMAMARREIGRGRLGFRTMLSLEPWTIPGCGYPDLLATGELCDGKTIHDRQHPHDLFMELAAEYERPLAGPLRWQVYGGLTGEPALGPVAFPHRTSAGSNALAPISHHWLDATHITFGLVTTGVFTDRWKAEGSVFNGREPDEARGDLDLAALDSFAGRFWFAPTPTLALQVSAGRLTEAEPGHHGDERVDVDRVTASATYHRPIGEGALLASTIAWGRNHEAGEATHAFLVEGTLSLRERHAWFGRFEVAAKASHDLDVPGPDALFTVSKWQAGYTHYLPAARGLQAGVGAGISLGVVPGDLERVYGRRANPGFALFATLRPRAHTM